MGRMSNCPGCFSIDRAEAGDKIMTVGRTIGAHHQPFAHDARDAKRARVLVHFGADRFFRSPPPLF